MKVELKAKTLAYRSTRGHVGISSWMTVLRDGSEGGGERGDADAL